MRAKARLVVVRHTVKVIAWVLYAALVALVGAGLVYDFGRPARAACESRLPWFEGLEVESATRHLRPPMLRCVAVDTDAPQRGQHVKITGWHLEDVVAVAAVAGPLVFVASRRLWQSRGAADVGLP